MIELLGKLTIVKEQQQVYVGIPGTLSGPRSKNKKKENSEKFLYFSQTTSFLYFGKLNFLALSLKTFLYFLKISHIFQGELLKPEKQKKLTLKKFIIFLQKKSSLHFEITADQVVKYQNLPFFRMAVD